MNCRSWQSWFSSSSQEHVWAKQREVPKALGLGQVDTSWRKQSSRKPGGPPKSSLAYFSLPELSLVSESSQYLFSAWNSLLAFWAFVPVLLQVQSSTSSERASLIILFKLNVLTHPYSGLFSVITHSFLPALTIICKHFIYLLYFFWSSPLLQEGRNYVCLICHCKFQDLIVNKVWHITDSIRTCWMRMNVPKTMRGYTGLSFACSH